MKLQTFFQCERTLVLFVPFLLTLCRYFTKLHPINGILDPSLHTPEYVRAKSSLLFTSILAITAQFEWSCAPMAKRLRLHGDKLLRHVHTSGFKSVEIVQGYYISLLSAQPAERIFYERNALYTIHAFGIAADLGLDQSTRDNGGRKTLFSSRMVSRDQSPISGSEERTQTRVDHNPVSILHGSEDISEKSRLSRNRERTWVRSPISLTRYRADDFASFGSSSGNEHTILPPAVCNPFRKQILQLLSRHGANTHLLLRLIYILVHLYC